MQTLLKNICDYSGYG